MKNILKIFFIFMLFGVPVQTACFAFSLNGTGTVYAGSAKNYAKYFPQNNKSNGYSQQQKMYIYSAKQAKYYGYRVPEQTNTTRNPYYNPYTRDYQ